MSIPTQRLTAPLDGGGQPFGVTPDPPGRARPPAGLPDLPHAHAADQAVAKDPSA